MEGVIDECGGCGAFERKANSQTHFSWCGAAQIDAGWVGSGGDARADAVLCLGSARSLFADVDKQIERSKCGFVVSCEDCSHSKACVSPKFFAGSIATTAASSGDEVWFEYNAVPLKWHYPVGVLFDLLIDDPTTALPWPLTVHFHGFPSADLMRCPNDEAIRSLYTNALKEANYLKHGDGGRVNKLSLDDSNNLWHGLLRHEFDTFWSANDKLVCALPDDLKSVPLRLCERDRPASQVLFEPLTPANAHRSLADLLRSVYPDRFSSLLDTAPNDGHPVLALVQGVAPPLATSVFWLATHFSHPDNFLYIVIKTR